MIDKLTPATPYLAVAKLPWFPGRSHGGRVAHPLVSLIVLVLILALVFWVFRRKPG